MKKHKNKMKNISTTKKSLMSLFFTFFLSSFLLASVSITYSNPNAQNGEIVQTYTSTENLYNEYVSVEALPFNGTNYGSPAYNSGTGAMIVQAVSLTVFNIIMVDRASLPNLVGIQFVAEDQFGLSILPIGTTYTLSNCYVVPTDLTTAVPSKVGITTLGRAGVENGNWPMVRNSADLVLESKTKGLVLSRNANPETTITNPVYGMIVWDMDENAGAGCIKIYTPSKGWKCYSTQSCTN